MNATAPLARLEILPRGLRMRSSVSVLRGAIPAWEAKFDELTEVQAIGKLGFWNSGIRFSVKGRYDRPIFWTTRRENILAQLTSMGVKVSSDPIRINWINPDDS